MGTAKTVTATGLALAGTDAGNYTVNTSAATSADITPLAITGSVTANDKVYDGTTAATLSGATLSGVIAGDIVTYSRRQRDVRRQERGHRQDRYRDRPRTLRRGRQRTTRSMPPR